MVGLGVVLVGASPENVQGTVHALGTFLAFGVGDISLILLALTLEMGTQMKWYTLLSGVVGLSGLAFYVSGQFLHLGLGGMERVAGYPQTFWLIVFGTIWAGTIMCGCASEAGDYGSFLRANTKIPASLESSRR